MTEASAGGPFKLHDIVETVKGAKFWGEIIAFDADQERPGCTVMAIAPEFLGTKHVYPLAQLRLKAISQAGDCAGVRGLLPQDQPASWPPLKKALWLVVAAEQLNDGRYVNAYELTDKLHAASLAAFTAAEP